MTNGKGDKLRKGANLQRYRTNYDNINWTKKETAQISLSGHQNAETNYSSSTGTISRGGVGLPEGTSL